MFTFNENEMKTAKDIKDKASMTFAKRNKEFIESEQRKQTIIGFDVLKYNEDYLNECIAKATPRLSKIKDVGKHLDEIRGVVPELSDEEITENLVAEPSLEPAMTKETFLKYANTKQVERREVTARKHYFEFIRWLCFQENDFYPQSDIHNEGSVTYWNINKNKYYTLEEVYDYWLKSVITTKDLTDDDQARSER
jgi:hypothetical protein